MDPRLQTALLSQLLWLTAAVLGAAMAGGSLRERLGVVPGRLPWRATLLAVGGFVALSVAADAVLRILALREGGSLQRLDELASAQARGGAVAALLILGVLPAICEELLFRGFAQRILVARLGAAAGVTASAALFGLAHGDPVHGAAAFALGLFLGAVAHLTGGVGAAVLCHGANNLLGVAGAMAPWRPPGPSGPGIALLVGLAALALWRVARSARSEPATPAPEAPGGELQRPAGNAEPP